MRSSRPRMATRCKKCAKLVRVKDVVECCGCRRCYHFQCGKLSEEQFRNAPMEVLDRWRCIVCDRVKRRMGLKKRGVGEDGQIVDNEESDSDSESSSSIYDEIVSSRSEDDNAKDTTEEEDNAVPEDVDDELVNAIKEAREKVRNHPPDIKLRHCIEDICFHPERDMIAIGLINGDVLMYSYNDDENSLINSHELHTDAIRGVQFNPSGTTLYTASKDRCILMTDVETGTLRAYYNNAHECAIYCLNVLDTNTVITGDEDGIVRMWDLRNRVTTPTFSIKPSLEYISQTLTNSARKLLLCASGDGTLTTIDMQKYKIKVQTSEFPTELTSMGLFRNETKMMATSGDGRMYFFNWGEFGEHSDEYKGLKQSISCMVPVTENIAVMSGEDGVLRAVHLFPNKHLGVVGQHDMPVEKIDISGSGGYLASYSHNKDVKFWNSLYFEDIEVQVKKQNKRKDLLHNLPSSKAGNPSDFFAGMS